MTSVALPLAGGRPLWRVAPVLGVVLTLVLLFLLVPARRFLFNESGPALAIAVVAAVALTGSKAVPQTVGPLRRDMGWTRSMFGAFAAMFPGFILAYYTTANGPISTAPALTLPLLRFVIGALLAFWLTAAWPVPNGAATQAARR